MESMRTARVLVIGNDREVVRAILDQLDHDGFETVVAYGGREGVYRFIECRPNIVMLSVDMPKMDGWHTAQRIREMSDVPIVFIADPKDKFSVERGLRLGDDYIAPPKNWAGLSAKLLAILRRSSEQGRCALLYDDGDLRIEFAKRMTTKHGQPIELTDTEFKLLCYLVRNPNRVLTHDEILGHVWGHAYSGAKSLASLYIGYLRRKTEDDPSKPVYFHTHWGIGYSFSPRAELVAAA